VVSDKVFGAAKLTGSSWTDQVCLSSSSSTCVEEFEYFAFTEQEGLSVSQDGILGMS
jgi:hypothetical protein